jgi:FtsZ-binding cell division protein ZapB
LKIEFLAAFKGFHRQAFKESTILSTFSKTGIVPYNSREVLGPLQERIERARCTELALLSTEEEEKGSKIEQSSTSTNTIELKRAREALFRDLERVKDEDTISSRLYQRIEQYLHRSSV